MPLSWTLSWEREHKPQQDPSVTSHVEGKGATGVLTDHKDLSRVLIVLTPVAKVLTRVPKVLTPLFTIG